MNKNRSLSLWQKKILSAIADAARISSKEISRNARTTRLALGKIQLIKKRKDLFSELGRNLYDAYKDGLPQEVEKFLKETEFFEIITELQETDDALRQSEDKGTHL